MKLITPPEAPFTLAEAKAHLRVDHDDDDAMIQIYMDAATSHIDGPYGRTRKAYLPQTWEVTYDAFPSSEIYLPFGPVISVTEVGYVDSEGVEQILSPLEYTADIGAESGWILPTGTWPTAMATVNAVRVRWQAGSSECPPALRAAILLMLGVLYDNRSTDADVPRAVDFLIAPLKRLTLA